MLLIREKNCHLSLRLATCRSRVATRNPSLGLIHHTYNRLQAGCYRTIDFDFKELIFPFYWTKQLKNSIFVWNYLFKILFFSQLIEADRSLCGCTDSALLSNKSGIHFSVVKILDYIVHMIQYFCFSNSSLFFGFLSTWAFSDCWRSTKLSFPCWRS